MITKIFYILASNSVYEGFFERSGKEVTLLCNKRHARYSKGVQLSPEDQSQSPQRTKINDPKGPKLKDQRNIIDYHEGPK